MRDYANGSMTMDQGMTDTDYSCLYERVDEIVAGVGKNSRETRIPKVIKDSDLRDD